MNLSMLVLPCSRIFLVQVGVYCLPCGWVGSWLLTLVFPSSREKVSQWELNHQPLHSEMGTSPQSSSTLWSSRIYDFTYNIKQDKWNQWHQISNVVYKECMWSIYNIDNRFEELFAAMDIIVVIPIGIWRASMMGYIFANLSYYLGQYKCLV